jgi:hypothetical protein
LYFAVPGFLWKKKVGYTWIHNHKKELSTLSHAHRVMENGYLTSKQAQGNKLNPKQNCFLKQTCGTP